VLEIGVPQPDAGEADPRRLLASLAEVEQAPLAPDVHLDGTGRGPVEADELVADADDANLTAAPDLGNNLGNGMECH
jgi:hypothetical protein